MVPFPNKEGEKEQVFRKDEFSLARGILDECGHLVDIQEAIRKAGLLVRRKPGFISI